MKFSVLIKTESRYPVNRRRIKQTVTQFLSEAGLVDGEVSLAFVGKRQLAKLAKDHLKSSEEHVVLAFPFEPTQAIGQEPPKGQTGFVGLPESRLILGDIIICYPEVIAWAKTKNTLVDDMVDRFVIYGLGHLLGQNPKWEY